MAPLHLPTYLTLSTYLAIAYAGTSAQILVTKSHWVPVVLCSSTVNPETAESDVKATQKRCKKDKKVHLTEELLILAYTSTHKQKYHLVGQEDTEFEDIGGGNIEGSLKTVDLEKISSRLYLGRTFLKIYIEFLH